VTGLALLPLDTRTLPGWPVAEDPSGVHMLFVLIGIPAIITLVIIVLNTVGPLAATNRATSTGVIAETPTGAPEVGGPGGAAAITAGEVRTTTVNTDVTAEHHVAEQVEAGLVEPAKATRS
jgi:hypothetical protein